MSKCIRCHVEVLDDSIICPLCQGVLKKDVTEKKIKYESSKLEAEKALKETEEKEDTKKAKKEKAKKEKAEDVQEPVSKCHCVHASYAVRYANCVLCGSAGGDSLHPCQ